MNQQPIPDPPAPGALSLITAVRWTRERKRLFLTALLATGNVTQAARAAGMSAASAHRLRRRLAGTPFDRAWAGALVLHAQSLADPFAAHRPASPERPARR